MRFRNRQMAPLSSNYHASVQRIAFQVVVQFEPLGQFLAICSGVQGFLILFMTSSNFCSTSAFDFAPC
jgi:hypothetical protein